MMMGTGKACNTTVVHGLCRKGHKSDEVGSHRVLSGFVTMMDADVKHGRVYFVSTKSPLVGLLSPFGATDMLNSGPRSKGLGFAHLVISLCVFGTAKGAVAKTLCR